MRPYETTDPFFEKQPPMFFVEDLKKPIHTETPKRWNTRSPAEDEVFLQTAQLLEEFEDPQHLLDTAYEDFRLFLQSAKVQPGSYPIRTRYAPTECFEAYTIAVTEEECVISAADTEGIRRGLVYLEDEMHRREGSFLPVGVLSRKPYMKSRITRCFFSPTNRPPKNGEELGDDIDYYPDGYLNRLAHDGVNGVWIYTHFRDLLPSEIIPEYGKDYKRRIDKLNRTIAQCARYGIKVYIFGVEPASTYHNDLLRDNHPDMLGQKMWGGEISALCTSTEKGRAYAEESTRTLFTLAPDLAGLIVISVGESCSSCASGGPTIVCPHCQGKTAGQVLTECEEALWRGMHSVKPEAEFISWTYGQRGWDMEDIRDSCRRRNREVVLMQNFEDWGETDQLGKTRLAIDYWLSYTGPGSIFQESAQIANERGTPMYAKLQVCCSHEVASIPYVPVPGILYKKYSYLHNHHVIGALQCWYFGNYPSLMSKAACELSFEPFFPDEDSFLLHLAGIYWGSQASKAVEAWKLFEKGYANYPVNVAFEWFGPMHDGPAWPLHLEPVDMPLSSTWLTLDMVGGDRLGECMLCGHSHADALELSSRMSSYWNQGMEIFSRLDNGGEKEKVGQQSVAGALALQFESGRNILRFYQLRDLLGFQTGDPRLLLDQMEAIVHREMEISAALSKLCEQDNRLGYHSEAEGFKYFPEKLSWRIQKLKELLDTEFVCVRQRVDQGQLPLPFYQGLEDSKRYVITSDNIQDAPWDCFVTSDGQTDPSTKVRLAEDREYYILQLLSSGGSYEIRTEFQMFHPYPPVFLDEEGNAYFAGEMYYYTVYGERQKREIAKWRTAVQETASGKEITIYLKKSEFDLVPGNPFRMDIRRNGDHTAVWNNGRRYYERLIFGNFSPDAYVFVIPRKD